MIENKWSTQFCVHFWWSIQSFYKKKILKKKLGRHCGERKYCGCTSIKRDVVFVFIANNIAVNKNADTNKVSQNFANTNTVQVVLLIQHPRTISREEHQVKMPSFDFFFPPHLLGFFSVASLCSPNCFYVQNNKATDWNLFLALIWSSVVDWA